MKIKSLWCFVAMSCACGVLAAPGSDPLQDWIASHATIVRSIDATDENFSDLEPLIAAIGTARVVQLGEPSHGAGGAFAAKVRLSKFLHRRMGFDVLVWESGLYDVQLSEAAFRSAEDSVAAGRRGILSVWAATEEVKPLFDYVKASQATTRPLTMAGFDMQITAVTFNERFGADLRAFAGGLRDRALRERVTTLSDQILAAHGRLFARNESRRRLEADVLSALGPGDSLGQLMGKAVAEWQKTDAARSVPSKNDMDELNAATEKLLEAIRTSRVAFEQAHGARHVAFMERAIENLRGNDTNVYDRQISAPYNEGWNRRDALNAQNLRWLVEKGYPGRKIIVWAHNVHVMNAHYAADVKSIHLEPQPGGLTPQGVSVAQGLREELYTIAMTSYEGEDGWGGAKPVAPASAGSLEARLHGLGKPFVFLDFRVLDEKVAHPLRQPQRMRIDQYREDTLSDVTQAFDAVFFIDRMSPAHVWHRVPSAAQ